MANLVNDTLSAWLLVESLQPGEVKYDKGSTLPKGNSVQRQFVKEQGDKVIALLKNDWKQAIENGEHEPSVYVISPFTEVKKQIQLLARKELIQTVSDDSKKISDWIKNSIETVHTFQGKEAKKVYFVIGTDNNQDGAVIWSCAKPNLLNVAVTRAKKEFYVIGDKDRIKSKPYYSVINLESNTEDLDETIKSRS